MEVHIPIEPQRSSRMKTIRKRPNWSASVTQSTFNIPGLDRIIQSPNRWHKYVWISAVLALYGLCVYQVVDRVTLYLEAPIAFDVSIEKVKSIEFPSVTICPAFGTAIFRFKYCQRIIKNTQENSLSFGENNLTLEGIWEEFKIKDSDVSVTSSCSDADVINDWNQYNETHCSCDDRLQKKVESYPTFWGNCLRITTTTSLSYKGTWTFMRYNVSHFVEPLPPQQCLAHRKRKQLENEIVVVPYQRDRLPTHDLVRIRYRVSKGFEVLVNFKLKRFIYLSTEKNPCVNEEIAAKCKDSCLNNSLRKAVKCSLPYMGISSLVPCKSFPEGSTAQLAVEKAYRDFDNCNCSRPCDETILNFLSDVHKIKDDTAAFVLNYPSNVVETITERWSYKFSALLSDVGGSLGFCIGLSLFSFIEIIVSTWQFVVNYWLQKNGKPHA